MQTSTLTSRPTLNPALRDFWLTPARNRVLYGGRSSSKSWDAAGFAVFLATKCRIRVLCARQFQNKIAESVYTLLKIQIERFGLRGDFTITENSIRHNVTGAEFMFYGLWRHIDEIKSLEGIDICWIEEAHNLTEEQWEILEPTLRKEGSQFWILFNPRLVTDFVWRRFIARTPPDTIKRQINYTENPFLSETILKVIEAKRAEDEEEYRHIYLGEPREDDDSVVIKRSWVRAALDACRKLGLDRGPRRRVGFDVADSGEDKNALVAVEGIEAVRVEEWKALEDELLKSAGRVHAVARGMNAEIDYDSIGVGAFAGAHFQSLNAEFGVTLDYHRFNAGDGVLNPDAKVDEEDPQSPKNRDYYANLKAQTWWAVAKRFRNTFNAVEKGMSFPASELISISPSCDHLDQLIDELSTPRRDFDNAGRVKVESKKDLGKTLGQTTENADSITYTIGLPARMDAIAFVDIVAVGLQLVIRDAGSSIVYDETIELLDVSGIASWLDFFTYEEAYDPEVVLTGLGALPGGSAEITIANAGGIASIAEIVAGRAEYIGTVLTDTKSGFTGYTKRVVDDFGNISFTKRPTARKAEWEISFETRANRRIQRALEDAQYAPAYFYPGDDMTDFYVSIYGIADDFYPSLSAGGTTQATLSLTGVS